MHDKQILPISLESFKIKQFQEHIKKLQLDIQHHNTKSKFKGFISSFIAGIISFGAALLTIIITLVVIYIVTGHFKLKTLVANIALQYIKTVEAEALNPNYVICENGLVDTHVYKHRNSNLNGPC